MALQAELREGYVAIFHLIPAYFDEGASRLVGQTYSARDMCYMI